jgi:hypothetical protein
MKGLWPAQSWQRWHSRLRWVNPPFVAIAGGRDEEGPEDGSHSPVPDGSLSARDVGMAHRAEVVEGGCANAPVLLFCGKHGQEELHIEGWHGDSE